MEHSPLSQTLRHLNPATAVVSVPVEATTAVEAGGVKALVYEVPVRLIDFFTPGLALLGGLVLLAFVLIARRPKVR